MEAITEISRSMFGKKYKIEVLSPDFEGSFDDEKVYNGCSPESLGGSSMEFSFDYEENGDDEIPDECIIVVNQSDLDKGLVRITEEIR